MGRGYGAVRVVIGVCAALALGAGCESTSGTMDQRAVVSLTRSAKSTSTARESTRAAAAPDSVVVAVETRPSVLYFNRLAEAVDRTRAQMPQITAAAEAAAYRTVRDGRLFVGGNQKEFLTEMIDRAGGVVAIAPVPRVVNRGDVILYAIPSRLTVGDRIRIADWRGKGVYVIAFASETLSANPYFQPDVLLDSGDDEGLAVDPHRSHGRKSVGPSRTSDDSDDAETLCPTDTVVNLINAWTWTGEYVAACTRLGRMPVLHQNLGESGAVKRAMRYRGRVFHDDIRVPAVAAGTLGNAYLDCIGEALQSMTTQAPPTLAFGGKWLREATPQSRGLYVASHLFPSHFEDPRGPKGMFGTSSELQLRRAPQTPVSVVIGYQDPPQIAIDAATMRRGRLIYTSARRDGTDHRQEVLYVNPHTPGDDACVSVAGYDITILPASSVMQAAVYWSLMAEANGIRPVRDDRRAR